METLERISSSSIHGNKLIHCCDFLSHDSILFVEVSISNVVSQCGCRVFRILLVNTTPITISHIYSTQCWRGVATLITWRHSYFFTISVWISFTKKLAMVQPFIKMFLEPHTSTPVVNISPPLIKKGRTEPYLTLLSYLMVNQDLFKAKVLLCGLTKQLLAQHGNLNICFILEILWIINLFVLVKITNIHWIDR